MPKIVLFTALLLLNLSAFSLPVFAQQKQFNRSETDTSISFDYMWQDSSEVAHTLHFTFEKAKLQEQFRHTKAYRKEIALRYVYIALQKEVQKISPKDAKIQIRKLPQEIQIQVKATSGEKQKEWLDAMLQAKEEAFDNYLNENHYNRYKSPTGEEGVKPDHTRFIKENIELLLPVAQAIYDKLLEDSSTRAYVNLLLSWIQSIPYNPLEDRLTSNGSGYLPPSDVINSNLGDCDSKAVLTAALLRSLLPKLSMVVIYLPNHAMLGASLPHREDELTVNINGMDYLLLEPTGPALLKAGEIAESSRYFLDSGMFTHEKVP
ncbi:hypothetical protein KIH87_15605 [Paraneptunicella aestuarii]|uniref:hypothetical protein n=1 Tax=Paraneptunicella aestuarii TaxID=2831148 RepID=UPI001E606EAD|nr:hypothetical protein [Paraneptunicella aestuarii]UAA38099.1 hypothetical protein KIH87_15605 [Paraneptunicella aestuarii]